MIKRSAIKIFMITDKYCNNPIIITGESHKKLKKELNSGKIRFDPIHYTEGYLNDKDQFLDRLEAMKEAKCCHQLLSKESLNEYALYDEDIFKNIK